MSNILTKLFKKMLKFCFQNGRKALCGICEKQIDSDASTPKAAGLEWII